MATTRTCPECGTQFSGSERLCSHDGAVLEEPAGPDPRLGQVLAGKYRIDAFLTRGGMGAVYRGTHVMLDKPVAIKLIHPELVTAPETLRRFQREARAASQLSHPNIVTVYDLGQAEDGSLYIAMELVVGSSLKDAIRSSGGLEPARAARILRQMCGALALAHKHGIIHRDLKPQNVMLCPDPDGRESVKLLDFGIAKTFEVEGGTVLTSTGMVLGTPHYMSPEQAGGKPIDGRSDIYALGVILYEMLVGEVPFSDTSVAALLYKHLWEPPQPPSLKRTDRTIPSDLEQMALRCLEKDPAKRFATVEELSASLESYQTQPAIPSAPAVAPATLALTQASAVRTSGTATAASGEPGITWKLGDSAAQRPQGTRPTAQLTSDQLPTAGPPRLHRGALLLVAAVLLLLALAGVALTAARSGALTRWSPGLAALLGRASAPVEQDQAAPSGTPALATPATDMPETGAEPPSAEPTPVDQLALDATVRAEPEPGATAAADRPPESPADSLSETNASVETAPVESPPARSRASEPRPVRPRAVAWPQHEPSQEPGSLAPAAAEPVALPIDPPVHVRCAGPREICGSMQAIFTQVLIRSGLRPALAPARAEILVQIGSELVEERSEQQFGTLFVVRTYSLEITAEAPRFGDLAVVPIAETLSFDSRFGRERLAERARLIAGALAERIREYWTRQLAAAP
jgi:serine/threonine-protein kinase